LSFLSQMKEVPDVRPRDIKEFRSKQSRFPQVPKLPMRSLIYGPSGSGKSVLLQSMILDIYKGCFERIYVFSPSIHLDHTWNAVKKYVREDLGVDDEKEPCFFETYDAEALSKIVAQQFKLAEHMKKTGKFVYNVLVLCDDFAGSPEFVRNSKLLNELYIRGRHAFISVITSVQKIVAVSPMIRTQATHTFTFRLRSQQDLAIWLEENSAIYSKKTLLKMYDYCVSKPFGFIYIDLTQQQKEKCFFYKFQAQLVPSASASSSASPASEDALGDQKALPMGRRGGEGAGPDGAGD
jgi:carboxylesterase type B